MLLVDECVLQSQEVVIVVLVELGVELEGVSKRREERARETHQVQNRDFHHALVEVGCTVLDDLHRNDLLGFQILAFYHLPKGSLA